MDQPYKANSDSSLLFQSSHPPSQPEAENRTAPRFNVEQAADIVLISGKHVMACTVLNISRSGALVKLENQKLPSHFILSIDGHELYQSAHKVWVKGNLAGIRFFQELASAPDFAVNKNAMPENEELPAQPKGEAPDSVEGSPALVPHKSFSLTSPVKISSGGFGKRHHSPK